MVCQHAEALEYDLLGLGIDILDLWRGNLSWRRVRVIVNNLPPTSAFLAEVSGDDRNRLYGLPEHLQAMLIDAVRINTWASLLPYVKKKPAEPEPIERPGVEPKKKNVRVIPLSEIPGARPIRK